MLRGLAGFLRSRFEVAAVTVCLDQKSVLPVVAFSAEFSGVKIVHGDLYGSLFHLGKDIRIMAVGTAESGIFMRRSVENDYTRRSVVELQDLAGSHCKGGTAC
jgi:hypothetical protein